MQSKETTRVLIISQYFPPDISGGGTRAFNYAKCLTQKGYEVTVITAHPHLHAKVPKEFRRKLIYQESTNGFNLIRVFIPSLLHTSARNRIILHFSFIVSSLFPIFSIKPDIIFASEPNLFSIIPAYIYSKIRGGKIIRIVDDLWPEVIYERGYVKSKIVKKFLDWLAKFSYNYSKYIVPLTDEAKNYISEKYNIGSEKIVVVQQGIDVDVFKYCQRKREKNFVLMYSGAIVESYDFDMIINAVKNLQNRNIRFVIRGKGWLMHKLNKEKDEFNLENLVLDSTIVPFEELANTLSKCDAFLIPMKNEPSLNLSLPTKIVEYQALGRPILCVSEGAPGKYIERTACGIRTDYSRMDQFVEAILRLESDSELCKKLGENGRKFVEEHATFEKIGDHLSRIIKKTLNEVNLKTF